MLPIQQLHPHLHQGLEQLGGVVGHHGDKQCVAARSAAHRLSKGRHLIPGTRGGAVAGPLQQPAVGHGDPSGQIPSDGKLLIALAAGLPDRRQVGVRRTGGQHGGEIPQPPLAGQVGREGGVEIHQVGSGAGKHRRQQLALHRAPGHVGPAHLQAGVLALPGCDQLPQIAVELGGQVQGPEIQHLERRGISPRTSPATTAQARCQQGSRGTAAKKLKETPPALDQCHRLSLARPESAGARAAAAGSKAAVPAGP